MTINKGDTFLEPETGRIFRINALSKYGTALTVESQKNPNDIWIMHTQPIYYTDLQIKLYNKEWVPNTPAARALYGNR